MKHDAHGMSTGNRSATGRADGGAPEHALEWLRAHLADAFEPAAAGALDAVLRLQVGDQSLLFRVSRGALDFDLAPDTAPDATFMFDHEDTARALLSGQADAFSAFMEGRFRSDGYLMWAFALMAMFRSDSLPAHPVE